MLPARLFDFVAQTGGSVIATPETELGMGMGLPATNKAVDAGVRFGLGVDIVSYGNGDMITASRLALQTARAIHCQPDVDAGGMSQSARFTTKDALHWATTGGSEAIGLADKVGAIEPGKQADIVLLRTDRLNMTPLCDPETAVVMHGRAGDIDTVLVDGQIRIAAGKPVGVDIDNIMRRLELTKHRILEAVARNSVPQNDMSRAYEALISNNR